MAASNRHFLQLVQIPIFLVLTLWLVHIFKLMFDLPLDQYGVLPRDSRGLIGILTSAFIHGSFHHLISNSVPLFVLVSMILFFFRKVAISSMILIYFLTGLSVWAMARGNVIHIGASGVVYGFVSFIFWSGLFRRNAKSIILALVVTVLYSGYFLGILPNQKGISWESHLFGALSGILVAYWMKDSLDDDEMSSAEWEETESHYLPRDTFEPR